MHAQKYTAWDSILEFFGKGAGGGGGNGSDEDPFTDLGRRSGRLGIFH